MNVDLFLDLLDCGHTGKSVLVIGQGVDFQMGYRYGALTPSVFHWIAVRVGELHTIKGLTLATTYSIAITGLRAGIARENATQQLADLLKVTKEKVVSILDSQKFIVKSGVDLATAAKYEAAIQSCGCACIVEPVATVTEDLIFDIPERLKRDASTAKEPPPENQERQPLVELNPNILKFIKSGTIFSNLVVLFVAVFVGLVVFNWASSSFFVGGKNVALASGIIKQSLRSPSSFSLVSGKELWAGKSADGNPAYIVRVEFDAQNGFGANIRECKLVAFYKEGTEVKWLSNGAIDLCEFDSSFGHIDEAKAVEMLRKGNSFK